jgi:hypothetical protein
MKRLLTGICLLWFVALPLAAQVTTAELTGSVSDPSGGAIAKAKVTATNIGTSLSHEALTDEAGNYLLTLLPPGAYNLAVEAAGFRRLLENDVTLEVNQRARVDFKMQLGSVNETVEVAATAPLLESQSSTLGTVVPQRLVNDIPLNGRNFVTLAIMTPGVNGTGFSTSGTIMAGARPDDRRPGSEIFSNGNREGDNNFLYDGVDNNERLTISIVLRPAVEAVREFKVQTSLYTADVGRNSGAVVDVITKSGANRLHGSAFEFLRNSAMDARSFFNAAGTSFPPFRYNQFGFSIGGPVFFPRLYNGRNRTFFFFDYEGFRRSSLNTIVASVPSPAMRTGDFSGVNAVFDPLSTMTSSSTYTRTRFPNDQIPLSRFDPITLKLVNAYPLPQKSGIANNYLANLTQTQSWNQGDVRIDHQFTSANSMFARWSFSGRPRSYRIRFRQCRSPAFPTRFRWATKTRSPAAPSRPTSTLWPTTCMCSRRRSSTTCASALRASCSITQRRGLHPISRSATGSACPMPTPIPCRKWCPYSLRRASPASVRAVRCPSTAAKTPFSIWTA